MVAQVVNCLHKGPADSEPLLLPGSRCKLKKVALGQAPHGQAKIASGRKKIPLRHHVAGPERSPDLLGCKLDLMASFRSTVMSAG